MLSQVVIELSWNMGDLVVNASSKSGSMGIWEQLKKGMPILFSKRLLVLTVFYAGMILLAHFETIY